MNLPNKLTLLRVIMIPAFVAVFFIDAIPYNYVISACIFALAAFTDFLDGYIARKYNLVTNLGKFLDPIADKALVATAFIIMLVPMPDGTQILPYYASIGVAIILVRELAVSGFRMVAASKGSVLAADWSGKIKTVLQDVSIILLLICPDIDKTPYSIMHIIALSVFGLAVLLTIISGAECIIKNRSVLKD